MSHYLSVTAIYKRHLKDHLSFYEEMSSGELHTSPEQGAISNDPTRVVAPRIDTCTYAEAISPAFDPNRALLRRVFFIGPNKAKYVSIAFYPTRNYEPMFEIGAPDKTPLLTETQVRFMSEHLTAQCDALCNDEYYIARDADFKMNTCGGYRVARVSVGKQYIFFKLHELRYLSYIFFMIHNQLIRYSQSLPDVLTYVTLALNSNTYVEPRLDANKDILYYQLFKELKSIV